MANYTTAADLTTYADARNITLSTSVEAELNALLTRAHDYIESKQYQGSRTDSSQTDSWPRSGVYVDSILQDSDVVPQGIKNAEMQTAIEIDNGFDPLAVVERATKLEKVDVIEVEYSDNASETYRLTSVNALLRPYLKGAEAGNGLLRV